MPLYGEIGFNMGTDLTNPVYHNASGNDKIVNGIAGLGVVGANILGVA